MRTLFALKTLGALALMLTTAGVVNAQGQRPGGNTGGRGGGDPQQMLDRMDANKDGKVTTDEFRGPKEMFDNLDANKDGSVTTEELTAARGQRGDQGGNQPGVPGGVQGGDRGGDRGSFAGGMERMQEMIMTRMKERLGTTDEEWTLVQPRLQKVMQIQQKSRPMGGMTGMFGRGGGDNAPQAMPEATALTSTLEKENATPEEIGAAIKGYREALKKNETELATAREELRQLLTLRQEAQLILTGILD